MNPTFDIIELEKFLGEMLSSLYEKPLSVFLGRRVEMRSVACTILSLQGRGYDLSLCLNDQEKTMHPGYVLERVAFEVTQRFFQSGDGEARLRLAQFLEKREGIRCELLEGILNSVSGISLSLVLDGTFFNLGMILVNQFEWREPADSDASYRSKMFDAFKIYEQKAV